MIGEGHKVVAAWTWTGTHLGDLPGIPPSGKAIRMSGLTTYHFDRGRLTGHWQVADRLGVYQQLSS
ncbi:MAG: ester cyclase [Geminicoccaceae bacterium]